jgi:NTE family protein
MKLREWLVAEPFALALSSSFFGFFAHAGVVAALDEAGIRPAKVTGASAGALIAAAVASGLSSEQTRDLLFNVKREDFWDPRVGFGYLHGRKFAALLEKNFVRTFQEARVPIEVAVFDVLRMKTEFIGSGDLISAVHASCAVPLMFHPVKREGRWLLDGGVLLKSAMNPKDARSLCIYLETPGWMGVYERRSALTKLSSTQKMLTFAGLPRVNPLSMTEGQTAYESAYERAKLALDESASRSIEGSILEA